MYFFFFSFSPPIISAFCALLVLFLLHALSRNVPFFRFFLYCV